MNKLFQGANNAIKTCMNLRAGEHVLIITDKNTLVVGNALVEAAKTITSYVEMMLLEDYGLRPLSFLPKEILRAIPKANVTFWASQSRKGELNSIRRPFMEAAIKKGRHGHMPSISKRIMEEGMCANYHDISKLTHRLYNLVKNAKRIEIENPAGTKLRIRLNPDWNWIQSDGLIHEKGKWGNLPDGELYTAAAESNGKMVVDELGDWFNDKYGCLTKPEKRLDTPLYLEIQNSEVNYETIESPNHQLKKDVMKYLTTDNNSNRVGEFALPTNIELMEKPLIGNLLQDEKGRVHVALGNPYPEETGANWQSATHLDCLIKNCSVWIDGNKIMESDKYII